MKPEPASCSTPSRRRAVDAPRTRPRPPEAPIINTVMAKPLSNPNPNPTPNRGLHPPPNRGLHQSTHFAPVVDPLCTRSRARVQSGSLWVQNGVTIRGQHCVCVMLSRDFPRDPASLASSQPSARRVDPSSNADVPSFLLSTPGDEGTRRGTLTAAATTIAVASSPPAAPRVRALHTAVHNVRR